MRLRGLLAAVMVGATVLVTLATNTAPAAAAVPRLEVTRAPFFYDQITFMAALGQDRGASIESFDAQGGAVAWAGFSPDMLSSGGGSSYPASGEVFSITDLARDRFEVGVYWRLTNGTRRGLCVFGNKLTYENKGYCDIKNIAEGSTIEFRVGRCDVDADSCYTLGDWSRWSIWQRYKDDSNTSPYGDCREAGPGTFTKCDD